MNYAASATGWDGGGLLTLMYGPFSEVPAKEARVNYCMGAYPDTLLILIHTISSVEMAVD